LEFRLFLIATIFSNVTGFIAIIPSNLRKICGHEDLLTEGFQNIRSAKALVTAINCNGIKWIPFWFAFASRNLGL